MVGLHSFCDDAFWNQTAVEDHWYPELSDCFQQTALTYVPCGWLWLTAGFHLVYLRTHTHFIRLPGTWLHTARWAVAIALCIASGLHFCLPADKSYPPSFFVSQSVWLVTYLLVCVLMVLSRRSGVTSPCVVFWFWLLTFLSHIVILCTVSLQKLYQREALRFTLELVSSVLIVSAFTLQLLGDTSVELTDTSSYTQPCPMVWASFLSKLTYSWMFSLVYLGYKKAIVLTDIFDVPGYMQCRHNLPAFMAAWQQELRKNTGLRDKNKGNSHLSLNGTYGIAKPKIMDRNIQATKRTALVTKPQRSDHSQRPSLVRALAKVYVWPLFKAQLVGMIADVLLYLNPLLIGTLIRYIENKSEYPKWRGYALALSFFAVVLINSILSSYRFYTCSNIGHRVKTVLRVAVYKKSLTMNAETRRQFTVGNIVNLMSVDCERFSDLTARLYVIISWPIQISIALFLLYHVIGVAFLAGIAVLLLLIPTNVYLSSLLKRVQTRQLAEKDQRIKLINETLNGVKLLKLYGWEPSLERKILSIRKQEVTELRKAAVLSSINTLCWLISPVLVTLASFVAYVIITDESLSPSKAFVTMNLINIMKGPMDTLPALISQIAQCQVSLQRLRNYLSGEDLDEIECGKSSADLPIMTRNATFTWDRTMAPVLRGISMAIPHGQLVAVVGPVGAGKSSLLSAVLREMEQLTGQNGFTGQVAYVPQQAWIQNMSLRNNILFEKPLEENFYTRVVDACALRADIEILPGGEMTEIGEKGINLSGGQKQRISLARAVYQNADVYLLDDPLSAVDAHVGKHIFQHVIGPEGILSGKTRVLVTHGLHWLPLVDLIIVMNQGRITETGSFPQLLECNGHFAEFVRTYMAEHRDEDLEDPEVQKLHEELKGHTTRLHSDTSMPRVRNRKIHSERQRDSSLTVDSASPDGFGKKPQREGPPKPEAKLPGKRRLIQEEKVEQGMVRRAVYAVLLRYFGYLPAAAVCFFLVLYNGAHMASGLWLSEWTNDDYLKNETHKGTGKYSSETNKYIGVYAVLVSVQVLGNAAFVMLLYVGMVSASHRLHNVMLNSILHQSMAFFDTTPVGRILNRFSRDVDDLDVYIARHLWMVLHTLLALCVTVAIIGYSTPIFLIVIPPLLIIYIMLQRFYVPSSRQFRRLFLTSRSPILSHFTETLQGASSIRAYRVSDRFYSHFQRNVDTSNKCVFVSDSAARWLKVRLEFLASLLVLFACVCAVASHGVSASLVALSVTYALQVTASLNMLVQQITRLETNCVAAERVVEYIGLPHEPDWIKPDHRPSQGWPERGKISFVNYSTRYRPQLDLVLKDISYTVEPGQKIGIVGRTGAGKSSLSMALFRVIEAAGGSILIDDLDISSIGLHDLRAGLTILPQDPVLFSGTVRFNLDPFDLHSDAAVWEALEHAHLGSLVRDLPGQLDHVCEEGGQNLSVGQRQLMCLARSLLRKTRILVLDEATAAVDLETDAVLQDTIRSAFHDCTVLTVAHRLNTVIDYDKILVLDNGKILEYGSPSELLKKTSSVFYSMARESGLVQL